MTSDRSYEFEVALSFAGEDRQYASQLAKVLRRRGVKVFFDEYEKYTLWGKNLYTHLSEVYQSKARYCVLFISKHYAIKLWTNHEREAAQARAFLENKEYILPVRLDDTQLPGIPPTVSYLSWPPKTARTIADALVKKLGKVSSHQIKKSYESNASYLEKHQAEMLKAYEQAIQIEAKDARAYGLRGEAYHELERFEEALDAYEQALRLDPDNIHLYINIGTELDELQRYEQALEAYNKFLEHIPDDNYILGCKSFDLHHLDRYDEALEACERSLQLDPHDAIMQSHKGAILYALGRLEETLNAYEQSIQLDPTLEFVFNDKGDVLFDLERFEDALNAYEHAIHLNPYKAYFYRDKGKVLYELKRYKDALVAYEQA